MIHFLIVGALVIVVALLTYLGLDLTGLADKMNPVTASAQAVSIDHLWHLEVMVMCFLFGLIMVPLFYSLIVFRQKKGELKDGQYVTGHTNLEITWTVIPLITVLTFAYLGGRSLSDINRIDPNALVIKVHAQQFTWTFEYPEYGVFTTELHLPVNRQVLLKMESKDVIHSFWVPEFRIKQDVVPGRITEYRITPTLEGSYKVRCAELCGTSHAYMENPVIVASADSYATWLNDQAKLAQESQTPEGKGKLLATKNGCIGCHSVDGTKMTGPTWFGLYDEDTKFADGTDAVADDAYIKESILDPNAKIVAGFPSPSIMPPFKLTDDEISDIIAYIKTLK
ncbi:MAG: cytochrome c oxidase subunit II [Anaerolineales bacterium]|nr:cytochrome c oxidase subunit II [Anaerolineales bacterium]